MVVTVTEFVRCIEALTGEIDLDREQGPRIARLALVGVELRRVLFRSLPKSTEAQSFFGLLLVRSLKITHTHTDQFLPELKTDRQDFDR